MKRLYKILFLFSVQKFDWWELKIALWNQRISWWWDFTDSVPGSPNTPSEDTNKISDVVLSDIKKDLMPHVNSEVENLKALIDNEFTSIRSLLKI